MTNPKVEINTNHGRFVIELLGDKAPKTVENFLSYVTSGHYDGTIFHRVIAGFMAQGGGFDGTFTKKPTRAPVQNESDNGVKNTRGTLSMARTSDPHSATCQFFVNFKDNTSLDHPGGSGWGYTVFGKVVEGMDVVDKMAKERTGAKGPFDKDAPENDIVISSARRV